MCDYQGHEFGASYPDSVCIDGFLWDADSGDSCGEGWCYTNGGEIPCPKCNTEAYAEYCREAKKKTPDIKSDSAPTGSAVYESLRQEGIGRC